MEPVKFPDDPLVKLLDNLKLDVNEPICASSHETKSKLSLLLKD